MLSGREKGTALALNAECLISWSGCANIAELMPAIWWVTPARTIGCRLRNRGGDIEMPRNQP
jgi:hypothetical protein